MVNQLDQKVAYTVNSSPVLFPKAKCDFHTVASINPKHNTLIFTVIDNNKQQLLTFEKLEAENV